jgi:hypothetical protein
MIRKFIIKFKNKETAGRGNLKKNRFLSAAIYLLDTGDRIRGAYPRAMLFCF